MSLLGLLLFLAAVITCYAAAIALLLCPWLVKGLRCRLNHVLSERRHRSPFIRDGLTHPARWTLFELHCSPHLSLQTVVSRHAIESIAPSVSAN